MSTVTLSDLERLSPQSLAQTLRLPATQRPSLAIIDVRDSDYIGGHIKGCSNVPTSRHDTAMPELVRTLKDKDLVVFHCALSQQRGPSSALRYLREKERLLDHQGGKNGADKGQRVAILEGGFVRWQELYGEDKDLTEDYQKDIWEFGY